MDIIVQIGQYCNMNQESLQLKSFWEYDGLLSLLGSRLLNHSYLLNSKLLQESIALYTILHFN